MKTQPIKKWPPKAQPSSSTTRMKEVFLILMAFFFAVTNSFGATNTKPLSPQQVSEVVSLANELEQTLREKVLFYWVQHGIDRENGGFNTALSRDWKPYTQKKTIVGQFRMVYVLSVSSLSFVDVKHQYIAEARKGVDYIIKRYWDNVHGGWFMDIENDAVVDSSKVFYAQIFSLFSFSTYLKATGDRRVIPYMEKTFALIQKHFYNEKLDFYKARLMRDWSPKADTFAGASFDGPSMGDHLHYLEAMLALYEVLPKEKYKKEIRHASDIVWTSMWDDSYGIPYEFFTKDLEPHPIRSAWSVITDIHPPVRCIGHQTEQSYLLMKAVEFDTSRPYVRRGISLLDQMWKQYPVSNWGYGIIEWQGQDGALSRQVASFWCQPEGINACAHAFYHTGDTKYIDRIKILYGAFELFEDKKYGSFAQYIHNPEDSQSFSEEKRERNYTKAGGPAPEFRKGHGWACCYHTTRGLLGAIHSLRDKAQEYQVR